MKQVKTIFSILCVLMTINVAILIHRTVKITESKTQAPAQTIMPDTLTDWQIMTLAMIEVESEYDSTAVSTANARGILQETPIYIEDVNRITGWTFTHMDAHDNTIALLCFDKIQGHYNPERDIDKAIRLHNPRGGNWYWLRVRQRMEKIKTQEYIRRQVLASKASNYDTL